MSERISDERLTAFAKGDIQEWQQNTFEEKTGIARELQQARARIAELEQALASIAAHMNADDESSYRADDPEGAMDTVYSIADASLKPAKPSHEGSR